RSSSARRRRALLDGLVAHGDDDHLGVAARAAHQRVVAGALAEQRARHRRLDADAARADLRLVGPDDPVAGALARLVLDGDPGAEEDALAVGGRLRHDGELLEQLSEGAHAAVEPPPAPP